MTVEYVALVSFFLLIASWILAPNGTPVAVDGAQPVALDLVAAGAAD
jgi:hypothetical protein